MNSKSLIRWLVIGGFATYGIYGFVDGIMSLARQHGAHWAVRWLILAPLIVAVSGVCFTISYFIFTRQYRRLCTLIAVVAAFVIFGCIISVPDWLGIADWADPQGRGALSVSEVSSVLWRWSPRGTALDGFTGEYARSYSVMPRTIYAKAQPGCSSERAGRAGRGSVLPFGGVRV